jgi:dethiobiotin synthetase
LQQDWLPPFLVNCGMDIGVMKPVETGFSLRSSDAVFLQKIAGVSRSPR